MPTESRKDQHDLAILCQQRANELECDCPPAEGWNASTGSYTIGGWEGSTVNNVIYFDVNYNNPCGVTKSISVHYGYYMEPNTSDLVSGNTTVSIPAGTGTKQEYIRASNVVRYIQTLSGSGQGTC